ncbi:hypothetical protein Dimus_036663, partial [Dionaea muscipula]
MRLKRHINNSMMTLPIKLSNKDVANSNVVLSHGEANDPSRLKKQKFITSKTKD